MGNAQAQHGETNQREVPRPRNKTRGFTSTETIKASCGRGSWGGGQGGGEEGSGILCIKPPRYTVTTRMTALRLAAL